MSTANRSGYVIAPGRLAALCSVLCIGLGVAGVARHPHDAVAQAAAAAALMISGLITLALLRGWVEPRRTDQPVKLDWRFVLYQAVFWLLPDVVLGRQHDWGTRTSVGFDGFLAVLMVMGLIRHRTRRRGTGTDRAATQA